MIPDDKAIANSDLLFPRDPAWLRRPQPDGLLVEILEIAHRLLNQQEAERCQLARTLHDGPLQELCGLDFGLAALTEPLTDAQQQTQVNELRATVRTLIYTLRELCQGLLPPTLRPFGLGVALRSHTERFQLLHPELTFDLALEDDHQLLMEPTRLALYRIYHQALGNVAKHAAARNVRITFTLTAAQAKLIIADDGCGFQVPTDWLALARQGQMGLIIAFERAAAIGGRLEVQSWPGQGTQITVGVPLA